LHGASGSRLESIPIVNTMSQIGINVLAFDFSGSGMSEV
jgi:hypothetical protein